MKYSNEIKRYLKAASERFNLKEEILSKFFFYIKRDSIWIVSKEAGLWDIKTHIERRGIRFIRIYRKGWKPTTAGFSVISPYIKKNKVLLEQDKADAFIKGKDIMVEEEYSRLEGFVAVFTDNIYLGIGSMNKGKLRSRVALSRRING